MVHIPFHLLWDWPEGPDVGTGSGAETAWNNPALLSATKNEHDVIMTDISNIFLIVSYSCGLETI
jgi:hypothetical protein